MTDENGYPLKLEGMGTVRFHWGSITRDKAKSLTIQLNDNFAGEERRLILKLSSEQGLYSEQIFIRQKSAAMRSSATRLVARSNTESTAVHPK